MSLFNRIKSAFLGSESPPPVADSSPITATPDRSQRSTVTVEAAFGGEPVQLSISISTSIGESNGAYGATAEQLSRKLDEYAYVFSPVVPAEQNFSPWFSASPCPSTRSKETKLAATGYIRLCRLKSLPCQVRATAARRPSQYVHDLRPPGPRGSVGASPYFDG
jgi:hypothetical protein